MSFLKTDLIKKYLKTKWLGNEIKLLETTESTNHDLKELGRKEVKHGFIIAADSQKSGRGRFNRAWFSPPKVNLYFSALLTPKKDSLDIPSITLVAAVSLHEAVSKFLPSKNIGIKWPNDILINNKKVAGILSEYHNFSENEPFVVVGLGLNINSNVFPEELQSIATSMALERGGFTFPREEIFASICNSLEKWYMEWESMGLENISDYWVKNSGMVGSLIKSQDKKGIVLGLSNSGALLIENINGETEEVKSGEIEVVGG